MVHEAVRCSRKVQGDSFVRLLPENRSYDLCNGIRQLHTLYICRAEMEAYKHGNSGCR